MTRSDLLAGCILLALGYWLGRTLPRPTPLRAQRLRPKMEKRRWLPEPSAN